MSDKADKSVNKRKWWFRLIKRITRVRYKKPRFVYLGEELSRGAIVLSNHEGTDAPMTMEIYSNKPVRFWGSYQMNSGLVKMYKYQTRVYYHEKKHWNLFGARMFCLLASPLTNLFYKGLNLISTYPDARFSKTLKESVNALEDGDNIVIFPEKSDNGYQAVMSGFYGGFALLAETCLKRGMDVPIYASYYSKKENVYVFDRPIMSSVLFSAGLSREEIAGKLCDRCNRLGKAVADGRIDDLFDECETACQAPVKCGNI